MTRSVFLLAVGACAALAGCNSYPPAPGPMAAAQPPMSRAADKCFQTRDIRNHTIGDDHTLYLDVAGRDVYRLTMSGACLAGAFSTDPIITREPPGSNLVCRPLDLDLSIGRTGVGPTSCIVQSIARLSPEEVAALPPRLKP